MIDRGVMIEWLCSKIKRAELLRDGSSGHYARVFNAKIAAYQDVLDAILSIEGGEDGARG